MGDSPVSKNPKINPEDIFAVYCSHCNRYYPMSKSDLDEGVDSGMGCKCPHNHVILPEATVYRCADCMNHAKHQRTSQCV